MERYDALKVFAREYFNIDDTIHGYNHALQVIKNSHCIANKHGCNVDLELLSIAALLHDMHFSIESHTPIYAYIFEPYVAPRVAKDIISMSGVNFSFQELDIILEAIKNHPHSFPFRRLNRSKDLYSQILQDADTLELFNTKRLQNVRGYAGQNIVIRSWLLIKDFFAKDMNRYLNIELSSDCERK